MASAHRASVPWLARPLINQEGKVAVGTSLSLRLSYCLQSKAVSAWLTGWPGAEHGPLRAREVTIIANGTRHCPRCLRCAHSGTLPDSPVG